MSKRDQILLLEDMLDSAIKIKKYTELLDFQGFIKDDKTIDAVVRNLEIIGEAANRIDLDFKAMNPDIEWNRIKGLRNRIVHDYFGIDYEIVWSIVVNDLDDLIDRLKKLIPNKHN
jgi:uncharacterized protein with HEPN domain